MHKVVEVLERVQEAALRRGEELIWASLVSRIAVLRDRLSAGDSGRDIEEKIDVFADEYNAFCDRLFDDRSPGPFRTFGP